MYGSSPGGSADCRDDTRCAIFQETHQLPNTGDYNISWQMAGRFTKFGVCTLIFRYVAFSQTHVKFGILHNWSFMVTGSSRRNGQGEISRRKKKYYCYMPILSFFRPSNMSQFSLTTSHYRTNPKTGCFQPESLLSGLHPDIPLLNGSYQYYRPLQSVQAYQLGLPYFTNNYHVDQIKANKLGGIFSTYGEKRNIQQVFVGKEEAKNSIGNLEVRRMIL